MTKTSDISIHAPRKGSDLSGFKVLEQSAKISIHAPRKGSDGISSRGVTFTEFQSTLPARGATVPRFGLPLRERLFQSTLPARGATAVPKGASKDIGNFNPRSPQGERPWDLVNGTFVIDFNPRSPQGERHYH